MGRRPPAPEAESGSFISAEVDLDALEVTFAREGTEDDGTPVADNEGFALFGESLADLIDQLDGFAELVEQARAQVVEAARKAQAADGEKVASNVGTTSAAPGGGET